MNGCYSVVNTKVGTRTKIKALDWRSEKTLLLLDPARPVIT